MISILALLSVGGFFTAFLFSINASCGDKTAGKISITAGGIGVISMFVFIGLCVKSCNTPVPLYEYNLHLYYLGGSERDIVIKSTQDPYISSYKGSYSLEWYYGCTPYIEKGVVRRDILSKKKIKDLTWKDKKEYE